MKTPTETFLKAHLDHAASRFRALITEMQKKSVTKVLLTFHPGYGMHLGISGTDLGPDKLHTDMQMVRDYDQAYERFEQKNGLTNDEDWFDDCCAFDWIRECWIAAEGPSSGVHAVLLDNGMDNGMDDEIDLNTGEEPDRGLGFRDIG